MTNSSRPLQEKNAPKKIVSLTIDPVLLNRIDTYAAGKKMSRSAVIETAITGLLTLSLPPLRVAFEKCSAWHANNAARAVLLPWQVKFTDSFVFWGVTFATNWKNEAKWAKSFLCNLPLFSVSVHHRTAYPSDSQAYWRENRCSVLFFKPFLPPQNTKQSENLHAGLNLPKLPVSILS